MENLFINNKKEIRKEKKLLEEALGIKIKLIGKNIQIEGSAIQEYESEIVFKAISAGFSAKKALLLKDENNIFREMNIKDYTKRKNLEDIRARIIGKNGKTKKTLEEISSGYIKIKDNNIGIICSSEEIESLTVAIINLIKGTKQANVYKYLERVNTKRKSDNDLGLKNKY